MLASGEKHDGRAPDYDDWKLNCDILFWHEPLQCALEISSMGIRVDEKSLDEQLKKAGCDERRNLPFHKMLLNGELPLTIGGGIGQSRICMLFLGKVHVGEVQASIWDEETLTAWRSRNRDFIEENKMEQKTKKWLVAGILTVAVAIGVGTCYSNTSDKSDKEKKEAVKDEDNKNVKEAKGISQDEMPYYPLTIKTKGPDGKEYETVYEKQPEKVVAVYQEMWKRC